MSEKSLTPPEAGSLPDQDRAATELAQLLGVEATAPASELHSEMVRAKVEQYIAEQPNYLHQPWRSPAEVELEYRQEELASFRDQPRDTLAKILAARHHLTRARAVATIASHLPRRDEVPDRRQAARELVRHFEQVGSDLVYRHEYVDKKRVYRQNHQRLLNETFLTGLSTLQRPLETFQKAETMLGVYWQSWLAYDTGPAYFGFLRQLEETPDDVAAEVNRQLVAVRGLQLDTTGSSDNFYGEPRTGELPKDLQLLMSVLAAGGFNQEQQAVLVNVRAITTIMPDWYTSLPLAAAMTMKEELTDILFVASWVINSLQHAQVRSEYRWNFKLDNSRLKEIVATILSGKAWITPESIRQFAQAKVVIHPLHLLQLPDEYQLIKSAEELAAPLPDNVSQFQVLSADELQGFETAELYQYQRRRAAEQQQLLHSPRLAELKVWANFFGQPLDSENMLFFAELQRSSEQLAGRLGNVTDQVRLQLFAELSGKGESQSDLFSQEIDRLNELYRLNGDELRKLRQGFALILRRPLFSRENQLDTRLVERAYDEGFCQDETLLSYLPDPAQAFYRYAISLPSGARTILNTLRSEFAVLCPDGRESAELVRRLVRGMHPQDGVHFMTKDRLAVLHGKEVAEGFLSALPAKNDERRNAFTHNDYDRTSQLLLLLTERAGFRVDQSDDFKTVAEFIRRFGLARSTEVYRLFQTLRRHQEDQGVILPDVLRQSQVETVADLEQAVKELRVAVMSEEPLTGAKLAELSPLQLELLEVITGKTSHRFDGGRPPFSQILADYRQAEDNQEIAPVAAGHQTVRLELKDVTISFDPEPVRQDYEQLRTEVLDSIEHPGRTDDLVSQLRQALQQKITATRQSLPNLPEKSRPFAEKNLNGLGLLLLQLSEASLSLDQVLAVVLELELGKSEQPFVNSLKRRLVLRRVFERHFSPDFIQTLKADLSGEITPRALLGILNVVDELVKQHALNLGNQAEGASGYWSPAMLDQLRQTKAGKKLIEVFASGRDKLKKAVEEFTVAESGGETTIAAIPCRDFTGEMAGYIADVCYTKEYPLLKGRAVTPYKFVREGETLADSELSGSVLVFDVTASTGEECLLVRGFDFPHESEVNIAQLIEGFLDQMAQVARAQGKQKVLVPSLNGAISNYQMTINHIRQEYLLPGGEVNLAEPFIFNGYDLTQNCYVARQVASAGQR